MLDLGTRGSLEQHLSFPFQPLSPEKAACSCASAAASQMGFIY